MAFLNKKKLPLAVGLFLLLISITIALSALPQKQQTTSQAAGSAVLSLQPSSSASNPLQKNTGETVSLDLMLDPGNHLVTFVRFQVIFDPAKLIPSATGAFTENTAAFPLKVESPTLRPDSISGSFSIGGDATKAIRTPTKVGTLTFSTIAPTNGEPTLVVFSDSQVLSSSQTDGAGQNVLSTTTPAYIMIGGGGSLSGTPSSSLTPPAILTPEPTGGTMLAFTVLLHGVGSSGDNPNQGESSLNNKSPVNPQRVLKIEIFDSENKSVVTRSTPMSYTEAGTFVGQVGLGQSFPTGNYVIKLKSDRYLRKTVPGVQKITSLGQNELPAVALVAGDINNDNALNVIDYNAMIDCGYGRINPLPIADPNSVANSAACQAHSPIENVDLDDNGIINNFDYNLFLRELSVQAGD